MKKTMPKQKAKDMANEYYELLCGTTQKMPDVGTDREVAILIAVRCVEYIISNVSHNLIFWSRTKGHLLTMRNKP
jgi:hypothetical protein